MLPAAAVCVVAGRLLPTVLTALFAAGLLLATAVVSSLRQAALRLETILREESSTPPPSDNSP